MAASPEHHSSTGVAPKTTVPERSRAPIPPYSRHPLGLIHSKWGQAWPRVPRQMSMLELFSATKEPFDSGRAHNQPAGGARIKTFGSLNSSTAKRTPSRPSPESFMPP